MRSLAMMIVVVMACCGGAVARGQTPTPDCLPDARFLPPDPTYVPGEPFTMEFAPVDEDWPTTPTQFRWIIQYDDVDERFYGQQTQEFLIPIPGPDTAVIASRTYGDGPEPYCSGWSTGTYTTTVRRFDYVPSPTPTPVTPTPSPTEINECVEYADYLNPPPGAEGVPITSLHIETYGRFIGIETLGGSYVEYEQDGRCCAWVRGLQYNTVYLWYFSPVDDSCFTWFTTVEAPTAEGTGWMVLGEDVPPQSHEATKEHEEETAAE